MPTRKKKEFAQLAWDDRLAANWRQILALALAEDLGDGCLGGVCDDVTTAALVPRSVMGRTAVAARQAGVIAGLPAIEATLQAVDKALTFQPAVADGDLLDRGGEVGRLAGPAASILMAERLVLNLLGRLSGIATLTRRYVDAVAGTGARIYDTRKTTPGWRRLEKYAVRCGGGSNHREALFSAVLIKDNHLALGAQAAESGLGFSPAEAVRRARAQLEEQRGAAADWIVEVEVDTYEQLKEVLPAQPDIVLLDNMAPPLLRKAVALRNQVAPDVELEASGGVDLDTVRSIAESGVDRISVGALTHSAPSMDLGLDWLA
ncbi:MAG: carboxylating nicotinate-nucleotide diphosphorylase [Patescibacteria group bacterium]|nr:carboxylating nicotinate-nucleotide diphosphorylase [Patescibacteria group bacterium]